MNCKIKTGMLLV